MSQTAPHRHGRKGPSIPDQVNVLLIGGGGREHALAWRIAQSPHLANLYTTHHDNPGLAALAKPCTAPTEAREQWRLVKWCDQHKIDLVVVGPEAPLAEGLADALSKEGRLVFGVSRAAAQIESNKAWAKQLMRSSSVPTAEARIFSNYEQAVQYLQAREEMPVIKASGLAAGKGVILPETLEEAIEALGEIMKQRVFGAAGETVVIEERLTGPEVSIFALVDGRNIYVLEACQDHKRLLEGDEGPNTGGMGAYSPVSWLDDQMLARIEHEILVPSVDAMVREEIEYRGVLYAGLMLTPAGPKVIEFNCRFGDPECQVLMTRLKSDVLPALWATAAGRLDEVEVVWDDRASCIVVMAAPGYPGAYRKGLPITGLEEAARIDDVNIFHAGTKRVGGNIVTSGGRVLGVTALGATLTEARERALQACDLIEFEGAQLRRDIGATSGALR